jgi:integrase/recombinase XerD
VTAVAGTVQAFFTERLIGQRRASPHTVAAYRDAIRLLLNFSAERTGAVPCRLDFTDLDAPVISAFLDHIERERGNTIRSRNARLAAIHSLFSFAALHHPEHAADIERVLTIPPKRADQTIVTFLTVTETETLLAAPDRSTRTGRRDHAWMLLAVQTGLRASELTTLTCRDIHLGGGAYVACHGKGRKDRITPLSGLARKFVGGSDQAAGAWDWVLLWVSMRCSRSSRSVRVNFQLNGLAMAL